MCIATFDPLPGRVLRSNAREGEWWITLEGLRWVTAMFIASTARQLIAQQSMRGDHQLSFLGIAHGPTDDPAAEGIQHNRQI